MLLSRVTKTGFTLLLPHWRVSVEGKTETTLFPRLLKTALPAGEERRGRGTTDGAEERENDERSEKKEGPPSSTVAWKRRTFGEYPLVGGERERERVSFFSSFVASLAPSKNDRAKDRCSFIFSRSFIHLGGKEEGGVQGRGRVSDGVN